MDLNIILFLVFLAHQSVFGTLIDLQSSSSFVHHCLASNQVIQIKDPFSPSWFENSKFIAMEWYRYTENGTKELQLLQFLRKDPGTNTTNPKYSKFGFWGLQINNVGLDDTAKYTAKLLTLAESPELSIHIDVASPPVLESETLYLSQSANERDNSVTLSCGKVSNLGFPPVSLMLKAGNGTILPTVSRNGFFEITVTKKEAESGKFTCDIDMSAPAAKCIDKKDESRWLGASTGTSSSQAGSGMISIIVGAVGGAVLLIVIIVIIVFVLRRRKKMKSETSNTKGQKKRDNEPNSAKTEPLIENYENPYDKPYVAQSPIYKGNAASPYHVSKISQGNAKASLLSDTEYEEMNCQNGDKPPARPSKFFKRGDKGQAEQELVKEKEGQKPPRAKPRSIFLTPSMEELDKINKAVAGGEGSGANGGVGTRV